MKHLVMLLVALAAVSIGIADELESGKGWRLNDRLTGPFRHEIVVTSPDKSARFEAEFMLINDAAEFVAELKRGQQMLGQFRCSFVAAADGPWFNVYRPLDGLDATGQFRYPEAIEELAPAVRLENAKVEYEEVDRELNDAYQDLMDRLTDAQKADLRERQRGWIEHKETISGFQARAPEGEERNSPDYWETAAAMTASRLGFLRHVYENFELSPSVSGTYIDEHGGTLSIAERGEDWVFHILVVRGPTFHNGFIRGTAQKTGNGAHFKDWNEENFIDGKPAQVTFKRQGGRLIVEGENTRSYHGARAYFDGEYFKVTDLIEAFPSMSD